MQGSSVNAMNRVSRQLRPAFTLIELVLVMAIIAVLAAIAVPALRAFGIGRQTSNGATLIVTLAAYARTQSASEGRQYRLNFDTAAGTVWLTAADGGTYVAPADPDYGQVFPLADGTRMTVDVTPAPVTLLTPPTDEQQAANVEAPPAFGPAVNATPNTLLSNGHAGPTPYVTIQPSGRIDPVHVRLVDKLGGVVDVGAAAACDAIHVLAAGELQ